MTVSLQPPPVSPGTAPDHQVNGTRIGSGTALPQDNVVVLENVRWETYEMLLADLGDHRSILLAFDQGRLQIMSPLPFHERIGRVLAHFIRLMAIECQLAFASFGSSILNRQDLQRGSEPDECFYFRNVSRVLAVRSLDLTRDPPPDLAVEIDITSSSMNRLRIYATLGIPEVWRFDGERLLGYHLSQQGTYEERETSLTFPFLRLADLVPFLFRVFETDEGTLTKEFQAWLRRQALPQTKAPERES